MIRSSPHARSRSAPRDTSRSPAIPTTLPTAIAQSIAFAGPAFAQSPLSKLTAREMEILRLLGAGKSLSEIAWLVQASYKTVANTSSIMRQKLGVRSSVELVRLAIENGVA